MAAGPSAWGRGVVGVFLNLYQEIFMVSNQENQAYEVQTEHLRISVDSKNHRVKHLPP